MIGLVSLLACEEGGDGTPAPPDTDVPATAETDTDGGGDTADTGQACVAPPVTGDPATVPLAGPCPLETRLGGFAIEADASLTGWVGDAPLPYAPLTLVGGDGACELWQRQNPFCDPACQGHEVCTPDDDGDGLGDCAIGPVQQDLGCLTLGGLAVPGALVELRTRDTTFGSDLELHGVGVEPIDLGADTTWRIRDGEDLPISWNGPGDRSTVLVSLTVDQSGAEPVTMTCELPDTGAATLPAAVLHDLLAFGVSGFPSASVTRRTVDSTEIVPGGCVDFTVASSVDVPTVEVVP
jgi:hypothetical protein